MPNRKQRRKAAKSQPSYRRGKTEEQLNAQFAKHGITAEDYNAAQEEAFKKGWKAAQEHYYETLFDKFVLASELALHDVFGFAAKRIEKFMTAFRERFTDGMTQDEQAAELKNKAGIEIEFRREEFDELQTAQAMQEIEEIEEIEPLGEFENDCY